MWIEKQWRRLTNPHNLTRIHNAREIAKWGCEIGDYSYGRLRIRSWGEGAKLKVGRYCSFADGVTVFLGGNHRADWLTTYPFSEFPEQWPGSAGHMSSVTTRGDVTIGSDVWIGAGATILSGVTIGHGAVIGAQAVVARDVEPYAVIAGNPGRAIRRRFDPATVEALLALAWWDLPRETVAELAPLLQNDDLGALLARASDLSLTPRIGSSVWPSRSGP